MKYYNYSVKDTLKRFFGDSVILNMRKPHDYVFKNGEDRDLLPLLWQYADEEATKLCLEEHFLLKTIPEDDYIVYLIQFGESKLAYLMFMVTEQEPFFHLDIDYAHQLIEEWTAKGYKTYILRECIGIEYYGADKSNGFHLVTHVNKGRGSALHELKTINGKPLLVYAEHSCWESYYKKLVFLSKTESDQEYECLFAPDVTITSGAGKGKTVLDTGIAAAKKLLHSGMVQIAYLEFENTGAYDRILVAGKQQIIISVNRCNLISELTILDAWEPLLRDMRHNSSGSLLASIPELVSMRVLDPEQIHGYAIQLSYADETIRNYYLCSFSERAIPDTCAISGFEFTREILQSAVSDVYGNVTFKNGFCIPRHYAYYRSYRQVQIMKTNSILGKSDDIKIRSLYRLPLMEFKSHLSFKQFRGFPDECFGPNQPWIDKRGNRISDIALFSIRKNDYEMSPALVCVEPAAKYGYLNDDGTWLVPPIYDKAEEFSGGCAKASRTINGEATCFLVAENGREKYFPFSFETNDYYCKTDRILFNAADKWEGSRPDAGYYDKYDYEGIEPGLWGIADCSGNIIAEPKYVYAIGYWNAGDEHSIVARYVDNVLRWGVIDLNGNEVIPCRYPGLYCRWGEAVAFQTEENGPYGLMDFSGNVIMEPRFDYIEAFDPKHRLVTAGPGEDDLGVFSLDLGKMIIPPEFDCIDYGEHMISCEIKYTADDRFFDYNGRERFFRYYDRVFESNGKIEAWKDDRVGLIALDGSVIIPPILSDGSNKTIEYYNRGYLITGKRKQLGLTSTSGERILPHIYTEIDFHGDMVLASIRTSSNWCICDTLYDLDGLYILKGPYRNIRINDKEKTLTVATPLGTEFCEIVGVGGETDGH